ncbi:MAG TPA: hypothetical protein VMH84_10495 [Xanthobacteraceae bacterium]|nr:hypothetical protein [Xanthobacteraceae bacterium]
MTTFIFRCPKTGLNVQGFAADEPPTERAESNPSADKTESYAAIVCTACRQTHLVNPKTGRVLTATEKQ